MARQGLIIRFSSLGDIILTSPAVLNLKIRYPDHSIRYLTKERFAPVVRMIPGVDDVLTIPDDASTGDLLTLIRTLSDETFSFVADLHGNLRSWSVRKVQTADRIAVYPKRRRERRQIARTHQIPSQWPHTIDLYNRCVKELDGTIHASRPFLATTSDSAMLPFALDSYVVIAPGAAHANKKWPVERFAMVASDLHRNYDLNIVWATTSSETDTRLPDLDIPKSSVYELTDAPISELASVIEQGRLTIANDSGIAHLSSAVNTPVIALFGPTHPALGFAPRGRFDRIVSVDEYCRPCSIHGDKPCFRDERYCFTRIDPDSVVDIARDILDRSTGQHPALFVDRDGTLIEDRHFLSDPNDIELIPGGVDALKEARRRGYKIVIVSNQSGVARGYFDRETVERVHQRLLDMLMAAGLEIDGLYYCPHYPGGEVEQFDRRCDCRKPSPGMAEQAAADLHIDLRRSVVIGDKLDDLFLGLVMGGRSVLVRTGYGSTHESKLHGLDAVPGVARADTLADAVQDLLK